MRRICGIALMLTIVVFAVAAAPVPEPRPLGGMEGGVLGLLRLQGPRLREELKLSESQAKKIDEMNSELRQKLSGVAQLSREDRSKKLQEALELRKAHEEVLAKLLTRKQVWRAEQIYLQSLSPVLAFRKPQVAEALKVTSDQKEKINLIREEWSKELSDRRASGQVTMEQRRELTKSRDEKILNVLTSAQNAKWKRLIGEPFKFEARPFTAKE